MVTIERAAGQVEVLPLISVANNPLTYQSSVAPKEPHDFGPSFDLSRDKFHVSHFKMVEPAGHHH